MCLHGFDQILTLILLFCCPGFSLRLQGAWQSGSFFKFLTRFGFQATDPKDVENTQGFIYGNITVVNPTVDSYFTSHALLVVVDSEYFLDYYVNRHVNGPNGACPQMFTKIQNIAWDVKCNMSGSQDLLRKVPCEFDDVCEDEMASRDWLLPNSQFTFRVQDKFQPRFWYVSLVACVHSMRDRLLTNKTSSVCLWNSSAGHDVLIHYDIWFVNGNPNRKHDNPFEHQFSFEMYDVAEIYIVFVFLYIFQLPIQCYSLINQNHMLPIILTACISMELTSIIFCLVHVAKFSQDGVGVEMMMVVGNFIDVVAQCLFMLMLLLIVKGWMITRMTLTRREQAVLFTCWTVYALANIILFIWNLVEVDIISDKDEWQTWPGYLILAFRLCIMCWFLQELRQTFHQEADGDKHRFYLHFGAGFLVWFVYLPIIALISTQISALWRYKTILSVTLSADCVSYCIMIHLLWPRQSQWYFNFTSTAKRLPVEELEFSDLSLYNHSDADNDSDSSIDVFNSSQLLKDTHDYRRLKQHDAERITNSQPKTPTNQNDLIQTVADIHEYSVERSHGPDDESDEEFDFADDDRSTLLANL